MKTILVYFMVYADGVLSGVTSSDSGASYRYWYPSDDPRFDFEIRFGYVPLDWWEEHTDEYEYLHVGVAFGDGYTGWDELQRVLVSSTVLQRGEGYEDPDDY